LGTGHGGLSRYPLFDLLDEKLPLHYAPDKAFRYAHAK
jgi:hypothetical protein